MSNVFSGIFNGTFYFDEFTVFLSSLISTIKVHLLLSNQENLLNSGLHTPPPPSLPGHPSSILHHHSHVIFPPPSLTRSVKGGVEERD